MRNPSSRPSLGWTLSPLPVALRYLYFQAFPRICFCLRAPTLYLWCPFRNRGAEEPMKNVIIVIVSVVVTLGAVAGLARVPAAKKLLGL